MQNDKITIEQNRLRKLRQKDLAMPKKTVKKKRSRSASRKQTYSEKRRSLRFKKPNIEIAIKLRYLLIAKRYVSGRLWDISTTGSKILFRNRMQVGKSVTLKIRFKDKSELIVEGTVIRREISPKYLYSIKFNERNALLSEKLINTLLKIN